VNTQDKSRSKQVIPTARKKLKVTFSRGEDAVPVLPHLICCKAVPIRSTLAALRASTLVLLSLTPTNAFSLAVKALLQFVTDAVNVAELCSSMHSVCGTAFTSIGTDDYDACALASYLLGGLL
jgi:hypothetical protein